MMARQIFETLLLVIGLLGISSAENYQETCVNAHNVLRNLHSNTGKVTWNSQLANEATAYAKRSVQWENSLVHDSKRANNWNGVGIGENLYYQSTSGVPNPVSCATSVLDWYSEINNYDYNTQKKKTSCIPSNKNQGCQIGHFTQLIWKGTTEIGMGTATWTGSDKWTKTVWVARYKVNGNMGGEYVANVLRKKQQGSSLPCKECGIIITSRSCAADCNDQSTGCARAIQNGCVNTWAKYCQKTCGKCKDPCASGGGGGNNNGGGGGTKKNGEWTAWKNLNACSKTCDSGTQTQTRSCTNPKPENGGQKCAGAKVRTNTCLVKACPTACRDKKEGSCKGWEKAGYCTTTYEAYMKTNCHKTCGYCTGGEKAIDGQWSSWQSIGTCSPTCGAGATQRRTRSCTSPSPSGGGQACAGANQDMKSCYVKACPSSNACNDDSLYASYCVRYAEQGYCVWSSKMGGVAVPVKCKKSCENCDGKGCFDDYTNCPKYESNCGRSGQTFGGKPIKEACKKTCNNCNAKKDELSVMEDMMTRDLAAREVVSLDMVDIEQSLEDWIENDLNDAMQMENNVKAKALDITPIIEADPDESSKAPENPLVTQGVA